MHNSSGIGEPMKRPTQKEVADACGVSRMAVALVLGSAAHSPGAEKRVSEKKREQIRRVARELGYRPHRQAQLLRGGRSNMIGMIKSISYMESNIEMARTASVAVRAAGYRILTGELVSDAEEAEEAFEAMLDARVEGLILQGGMGRFAADGSPELERLEREGVPMVTLSSPSVRGCPMVAADHRGGMRDLVRHVVARGFRRLAYVALLDEHEPRSAHKWVNWERLDGFRDGAREAGLGGDAARVVYQPKVWGHYQDFEPGRLAARRLLEEGRLPDAVLCHNDACAAGFARALLAAGKRVPDDVAVTGFDASALAEYGPVAITSMEQPVDSMGRRAVERLRKAIDDPERRKGGEERFACRLVERASTARRETAGAAAVGE